MDEVQQNQFDGGIPINPDPPPAAGPAVASLPVKAGRPPGSRNRSTMMVDLSPYMEPLTNVMTLVGTAGAAKAAVLTALKAEVGPAIATFVRAFAAQHLAAHLAAVNARQAELAEEAGE